MKTRVGIVYDDRMSKHAHTKVNEHPERPGRITEPYRMLEDMGYTHKCTTIPSRLAQESELSVVHTLEYIKEVKSYETAKDENPCKLTEKWPTYTSDDTFESAICAVGCTLNLVDAIMTGKVCSGVALVRPPGHHAEVDESCGFCFFNNIALAARRAKEKHGVNKVLILDWDIHHGNGTQHIFYEDDSVLYISLHRFDNGEYFPGLKDASHEAVGTGKGEGFNVNIPWNKDLMGNTEYKCAFDRIVLPIANQFAPDLVLISAGFDAALADPLGEYILSAEMYGYMTEKMMSLAGGKVAVVLEGGYSEKAIGACMVSCLKSLLKERTISVESLDVGDPCKRGLQTLSAVITCQSKYWNL